MLGSDFDRPGWHTKANYNIGIGHTFSFLKKDPIGDEVTFAYTYENGGPGFWHSQFDSDTESLGIMKNFGLPKTKRVTAYSWVQIGITTLTGLPHAKIAFTTASLRVPLSILTSTIRYGFRRRLTRWLRFPGI